MKGSQRVSKAIHFEKPDRVPYIGYNSYYPLVSDVLPLFPLTPTSWQPPPGKYPHVHPMQLQFHLYKWKPMGFKVNPPRCWKKWKNTPHQEIDEWGVIWEEVGDGTMGWPVDGPLKSWEDLDNLKIPDGSDPARYSLSRKINKLVPKSWKYRLGLIDNFLFERTHFLRGWNRYMHDLVRNPQKIRELIKIILPYYEKMIRQLHEMGAQCVFTTDD
ncbi:MAG TPA: hypothetical protein VKO42_01310, partial [Patescibacteria group bacterium]|nr:hypothetical protein [Patescibacteria group bacterium]